MTSAGLIMASWHNRADRRRALILSGSILLHGAVLGPLAWGLFNEPPRVQLDSYAPPIFIEIEPRPLLRGETAREPTLAVSPPRDATPVLGESAASTPQPQIRPRDEDDQPSTPNPRPGVPAPAGTDTATIDSAWRVAPQGMGDAVARSLRTGAGGCRIMDGRLRPGEQQLCDERFNEAAGRGRNIGPRTLNPSEQRRQDQYARDGANAIAQYEARRRPLAGGVGIIGVSDCPGSNFGAGCAGAHLDPAMRQGATTVGNPGMRQERPDAMRPIPGQD